VNVKSKAIEKRGKDERDRRAERRREEVLRG
jgi:hypothetical protein